MEIASACLASQWEKSAKDPIPGLPESLLINLVWSKIIDPAWERRELEKRESTQL